MLCLRRTFTDINLEILRPDRSAYQPVGAVVHLLASAIEERLDLSSLSGVLADSSYRLLRA